MGSCDAVGYEIRPANAAQRVFQRGASTRAGAWLFSKTAHHLDRFLLRRTHGRTALATLVAGLPVITVTTTGAKSGLPRALPLLGIPIDGDLALIGTNFGQTNTPGWVYNLEADPTARVTYRDRSVDVRARRANPDETATALTAAAARVPGLRQVPRADHRTARSRSSSSRRRAEADAVRHAEFEDPRLVEVYDATCPWSRDDDFFVAVVDEARRGAAGARPRVRHRPARARPRRSRPHGDRRRPGARVARRGARQAGRRSRDVDRGHVGGAARRRRSTRR